MQETVFNIVMMWNVNYIKSINKKTGLNIYYLKANNADKPVLKQIALQDISYNLENCVN